MSANHHRAAFSGCDGDENLSVANACSGGEFSSTGTSLNCDDGASESTATSGCTDRSVGINDDPLVVIAYLGALLEGSLLCAASEVR